MEKEFSFEYLEQPEWGVIGQAISEYNNQQAGDDQGRNLCFVMRDSKQDIVGGVIGATYWGWLYINLMWVREELRGRDHGQRLLVLAEEEARQRGAKHAYLDTFSFQAPGFYEKHGYRVFGELPDFPVGHRRYFMVKTL
jgi:ribosomal protein S18 acetylase RimI-like enzyme